MPAQPLLRRALRTIRDFARYAPTPRFAAVLAIAAPVWLLSSGSTGRLVAAATVAVIGLALLIDVVRIPGKSYVTLQRDFPASIGVGDVKDASYEITSTWPLALNGGITQQLPPAIALTRKPVDNMPISNRAALVVPVAIQGKSRGVVPLGPVALTIRGPWGLAKRSLVFVPGDSITVVPSITGAGRYRLLATQHRLRTAGLRAIRRRGGGTSFANLRDYVPGDDPRNIDWKATARRQHLISREFTVEQGQTVMLAIDCGRMMTQLAGDRPRFEFALASALTLADTALSTGDRVGLIAFDSSVRRYIAPTRAPGTIGAIRDALTSVTATMTEPDYAAAFRTLTERNRRRSLIVLFTDVIDVRSSRAVIALSARSALRHLPVIVALRNEQLATAAIPSLQSSNEQAYESVAAEELISARETALQNMRQTGVTVLDTPPATMTAALVNRYLEIKARTAL